MLLVNEFSAVEIKNHH